MPKEFIETETIFLEPVCDEVSKCDKSLQTLYLKKTDEDKLINLIHTYCNSDIYKKLEISKKFGLVMSGLPGTGKTTLLKVIAYEFQLDIYYINLSQVKKNSDFKLLSDYVYLKKGSGFVVMEDVDAMTDVLNKRDSDVELSPVSSEEDDFNLSFLLNWLDGSHTPADLVVAFSTNHIEKIDPAVLRKGRIDMIINFTKCDHYQINKIYKNIKGRELNYQVLRQIPEFFFTPADIIFHLKNKYYDDSPDNEIMKELIDHTAIF